MGSELTELINRGVVLLRDVFPRPALVALKRAAEACFQVVEAGAWHTFPEHYRFTPYACSLLLPALLDFGFAGLLEPVEPLTGGGFADLVREIMGSEAECRLQQSWLRKRYAPMHAPPQYHPNVWHQDGGLGVTFGAEAGQALDMTLLLTCWLPLDACDGDRPGLEFVRRRLESLLPYPELSEAGLRKRFAPEEFWAPRLEPGDGLIFLNGTLHRSYVQPAMRQNRLSVEYRFFPTREGLNPRETD